MKSILPGFAVLIVLVSLLASCGGGSSGGGAAGPVEPDFVSITVEGGAEVLYTETTSTMLMSGYSPYLYLMSSATPTISTYLYSHDWDGVGYVTRFQIHLWGSGPGTYNISDNHFVYFVPAGGPTYSAMSNAPGSSGTITFTEFGAPGGMAKGAFDVIALIVNSSPTQTARLTGSFSVNRY